MPTQTRLVLKVKHGTSDNPDSSYFLADIGYKFILDGKGKLSVCDSQGQLYYRYNVRSLETIQAQYGN